MKVFKIVYPLCFCLLLIGFTAFVLLNTFVLQQTLEPVIPLPKPEETVQQTAVDTPDEADEPPEITDTYYKDKNIEITLTQYREYDSDIHVAEIKLSDPNLLKTAIAENLYGKNIVGTTSEIAYANNAIFAVNGDFYGAQEEGYVLKNGILYRNIPHKKQEDLVIYKDGSWDIFIETETTAESLYEKGAYQILAFGPSLIHNGELTESTKAPRGAIKTDNPRTAMGIVEPGHYIFVVCDGRTEFSKGMTVNEVAEFLQRFNVTTAYNLDGGGSATMYFNGRIVNTPTFNGNDIKERSVSDIVYIGY